MQEYKSTQEVFTNNDFSLEEDDNASTIKNTRNSLEPYYIK